MLVKRTIRLVPDVFLPQERAKPTELLDIVGQYKPTD